ncbi:hypothetical protein TWF730_010967 [Orbilia blumenaviensis]|uniref:Uncharacterized protein n=1 Tax=Orbilia blumenaviensis TaxID=1796055 RepID=A0AAV9UJA7_9PEZI
MEQQQRRGHGSRGVRPIAESSGVHWSARARNEPTKETRRHRAQEMRRTGTLRRTGQMISVVEHARRAEEAQNQAGRPEMGNRLMGSVEAGRGGGLRGYIRELEGVTSVVRKPSVRRGAEIKIQTMRAQEAADPSLPRYGSGGWAGEFFNFFRRSK